MPELAGLSDVVWNDNFIMAVPMMFYKSARYKGRGKSIFDAKIDNFDALDETWSQWMDALRKNRTKEYIPENMLPRNPYTGKVLKPNAFDNAYISTEASMKEGQTNKIDLVQGNIPHESYLATYITALDLCLQGIMSPSTLGIDVKKLDNAEAQREKEKATLYSRNNIVGQLQKVLPKLVDIVFKAMDTFHKTPIKDIDIDVTFGEYANPSFESQVETVSKAKQGGIMSIEASVDELYGDTKDDEWKQEGGTEQEQKILRAIKKGLKASKVSQGTEGAFFKLNTRKLDALIKATKADFTRAEHSMLRMSEDKYRQIIFNAQVYANTGAGTYEKAVDMATRDFLKAGINCIEYANGSRHTVKDYARMAIQTASKRAYLTGEGEMRQSWGISTVIMNKRANACPKCLPFVGKVLIDDVWSGGDASDGNYPLMSSAIAAGLYHP